MSKIVLMMAALPGLAACHGGIHARDNHQMLFGLDYAAPSGALSPPAPNGAKGTARNAGATVMYNRFVWDRLGVNIGLAPIRWYDQSDGSVFATELEVGLRYFPFEFSIKGESFGLFVDLAGGLSYSDRSVPESGTHWNYLGEMGVGLEWRTSRATSWTIVYHIKHLSNGKGPDSTINPSQNEHQFTVAFAVNW